MVPIAKLVKYTRNDANIETANLINNVLNRLGIRLHGVEVDVDSISEFVKFIGLTGKVKIHIEKI